jgi:hypothetical protein
VDGENLVGMPSDTHGDDPRREPEAGSGSDATQVTPEVGPPDQAPDADTEATPQTPDVGTGPVDETTAPIAVADDDTDELPVAPTMVGAPPVEEAVGAGPTDRAHRNRRRALIGTLLVAIVALVGLGAAILATADGDPDETPASTSSTSTTSTVPPTTEGQTPAPSGPEETTTTTAPTTTTTTSQPTTTTAPTTTTTQPTTTTAPTTTSTTTAAG